MTNLEEYKQFAVKKDIDLKTNNAVIYTRVSSKEQADGNTSLETQMKYCKEYATKKGMNVVQSFGGTYESAKSDERKEFNKMLTFLKRRNTISYIIVYSYDRFSRTGANAAYISSNLKKRGIHTVSVSQDVDTSKPSGVFQENLYYMFSQFDNELRKDKTITGMTEQLRNGNWCFSIPAGYTKTNIGSTADKGNLVLNEKGKMIKKAFDWVYKYGWSISQVSAETKKRGGFIPQKRLSVYLRNPFYAGLIVSSLIPGEVYEGKQEKAISYKKFKRVNDILNGKLISRRNMQHVSKNDNLPLRGTLQCSECGSNISGYKASKNQEYYYKCPTTGCKNNQRADQVHAGFKEVLSYFQIEEKNVELLKIVLADSFKELNQDKEIRKKELKTTLRAIDGKLDKLEEKYIFDGINQAVYQKHLEKLTSEKNEILAEINKPNLKLANLKEFIDYSVKISSNMLKLWEEGDYERMVSIQKMLFPKGITYDRKNQQFRTLRVNNLFAVNSSFSESYGDKKEKGEATICDFPLQVNPKGFEPLIATAVT